MKIKIHLTGLLLGLLLTAAGAQAAAVPDKSSLAAEEASVMEVSGSEPEAICLPVYRQELTKVESDFDGKILYEKAFLAVYCRHLKLADPQFRQSWSQEWRDKFASGEFLQTREGTYTAIKKMLASLQIRFDNFFAPDEWKRLSQESSGELEGVGLSIGLSAFDAQGQKTVSAIITEQNPLIVVAEPEASSPAARASIKKADLILKIDGVSLNGKSIEEAAAMLRGKAGTELSLSISRRVNDKQETLNLKLTRAEIVQQAVLFRDFGDIAYIAIGDFLNKHVDEQMALALEKAKSKKGLIVDLRNNPGGELSNTLFIAEMMMSRGVLYSYKGRKGDQISEERFFLDADEAKGAETRYGAHAELWQKNKKLLAQELGRDFAPLIPDDLPIIVLSNEHSASGSEILAGLLKANYRAILLGTASYGKNLGQEVFALPFGTGIRVSSFEFLPGGIAMEGRGIKPDIVVRQSPAFAKLPSLENDAQMQAALKLMKTKVDEQSGSGAGALILAMAIMIVTLLFLASRKPACR